ncbi:penicillin-binding protein [Leucobacter sp. Ag1]|nr:penicillin-binding protein [Leucobacter sp. Ag1]
MDTGCRCRLNRRMTESLRSVLERHAAEGVFPGLVGVDGAADGVLETVAVGALPADAIVRIQSMTKSVLAVATLRLVQQGRLGLDDPVERWLPELADRRVLREPNAELDDTVPAERPITIRHLLTNTSGYGVMTVPCPLGAAMAEAGVEAGQEPLAIGAEDWLRAIASLPLAFHPGEGWRYHHSFGILGILLSRATGGLDAHLRRELFEPLGMVDTGFSVPREQAHRLPAAVRRVADGSLVEVEPAAGGLSAAPAPFDLSHSELVSTAADFAAFARMLADGGRHEGRSFLAPELLDLMRADQVPERIKAEDSFFPGFWDGTGWGFGVSVLTQGPNAGRFGWSGGLGTDFFVDPDGSFRVVLTQLEMGPEVMRLFAELQ